MTIPYFKERMNELIELKIHFEWQLTCGRLMINDKIQEKISKRWQRCAMFSDFIGYLTATQRSMPIKTITYVDKYNANIWNSFTSLQANSPAIHSTVYDQAASPNIQNVVTSKSAMDKCNIRVFMALQLCRELRRFDSVLAICSICE